MRRSRTYTIISWIVLIAWAGLIFYLSSRSSSTLHTRQDQVSAIWMWLCDLCQGLFGKDADIESVIGHGIEYAGFGFFACNALSCHFPVRRAFWIAIIIGACYGLSDECHQLFVPGRAWQLNDLAVDTIGATLGSLLYRGVFSRLADKIGHGNAPDDSCVSDRLG